jgi:hypothetical protein
MALTTVSNGNTANASDLNQVINVLQQPSGGQEKGTYWLGGNGYTTNAYIQQSISSLSRVSTPVSVSIDTAIQAPIGNLTNILAGTINSGGFHVYGQVSSASSNAYCGGNYTLQF